MAQNGTNEGDASSFRSVSTQYDSPPIPPEAVEVREDTQIQDARNNAGNMHAEVTEAPDQRDLLGKLSIFGIIVNRMIGTGIFDTPTSILQKGHSPGLNMVLWAIGLIASFAGTLVYVEYGLTIPRWVFLDKLRYYARNGGELNYLNYLIKKSFFASCMFGVVFVIIGNSAANSISFAVHVLRAAGRPEKHLTGAVQGIALGATIIVCIIHIAGRNFGVYLNNVFAVIKVAILFIIVLLAIIYRNQSTTYAGSSSISYSSQNLGTSSSFDHVNGVPKSGTSLATGIARSYLNIIFTYGGFNQANYVLGEIDRPSKIYRRWSLITVTFVGVMYMLVNFAFLIVVPLPRETFSTEFSVVKEFFRLTVGKHGYNSDKVMNSFIAVSSLGNIIVTTFTAARVKQEIFKEGIVYWIPKKLGGSRYLERNYRNIIPRVHIPRFSNTQSGEMISTETQKVVQNLDSYQNNHSDDHAGENTNGDANGVGITFERTIQYKIIGKSEYESIPVPAYGVHCIFTAILVGATWRVKPADIYPLLLELYSYDIDAMVAMCLGLGLIFMRLNLKIVGYRIKKEPSEWNRISQVPRWLSCCAAVIVVVSNAFPIVVLWIPGNPGSTVSWYVVPMLGWVLIGFAFMYWVLFSIWLKWKASKGFEFQVKRVPFVIRTGHDELRQFGESNMQGMVRRKMKGNSQYTELDGLDHHGHRRTGAGSQNV